MFRPKPITEDIHEHIALWGTPLNIQLPDNYENYTCSISHLMMFDPATTYPCGHTHERIAIEAWQAKQKEQKANEEKAAHPPTCWCRTVITRIESNNQLKNEINQFLTGTQSQLQSEIDPTNEFNPKRLELITLIDNFLKYGNHQKALQKRYIAKFKEASGTYSQYSVMKSRTCTML